MKYFCSLLIAITLFSCKNLGGKGAGSDKLFTSATFYVRYDETDRTMMATASFKRDTNSVKLPAGLLLNNKALTYSNLPSAGRLYTLKTQSAAYLPKSSFMFADEKDESNQYVADMPQITGIKTDATIDLKKGLSFTWEGKPLLKEETLVVLVQDGLGATRALNVVGPSETAGVTFLPVQLEGLKPGKGHLDIVRKVDLRQTDAKGAGVTFQMEYYSPSIAVDLK